MILLELVKHELYKVFSKKLIYVALAIFVALFLLQSTSLAQNGKRLYGDYKSFYTEYKKYKGPLTPAKLQTAQNWLNNEKDKYTIKEKNGDMYLTQEGMQKNAIFDDILNTQQRIINYNERLSEVKNQLQKEEQGSYKYETAKLQYSMLSKVPLPGILWGSFGPSDLIDFIYSLGFIFIGAMVLLGISPIFSDEYSNNTDCLILTTKNGKGPVVTAKIIASMIYIAIVGLFFSLLNFITVGWQRGLLTYAVDGLNYPLNSLYKYAMTPYNWTIIKYYTIQTVIFILGAIAFGFLVIFISSLSKNNLTPFFIGGVIFSYPIFLKVFISNVTTGPLAILMDINYTEFIRVENLFNNFKAYNILGHPVLKANAMIILFAILSIFTIVLTYKSFKEHQVI